MTNAGSVSGRNKAPVFVVGCPRSGTTLLYHMLLSAGGFAIYRSETNFFNILLPRFGDLSVLGNRQRLMEFWLTSLLFRVSELSAAEIEAKVLKECMSSADFLPTVMGEVARRQGVERWADCTPEHLLHIPEIKQAIPKALIIHIIRDGRDTALSLAKQDWVPPFPWGKGETLMVAGIYWEWMVEKGRKHGAQLASDYAEVRYEELLLQPCETLARLGRFIDQNLDYNRIRQVAVGSVAQPNTSFTEESGGRQFDPIGRWRNRLQEQDLSRLEGVIGGMLQELGYALATSVSSLRDRHAVRRMRALYRGYFGLRLWLKMHTRLARFLVDTRPIA
jgi:Sulfotransferase family